jgi:hypothetical protein
MDSGNEYCAHRMSRRGLHSQRIEKMGPKSQPVFGVIAEPRREMKKFFSSPCSVSSIWKTKQKGAAKCIFWRSRLAL